MNTNTFNEEQKFRQWWLLLILALPSGLIFWATIQQLAFGVPFGTKPAPDYVLLLMLAFFFLMNYLLLSARLETRIDTDGVHYRWRPFMRNFRSIPWSTVRHAEVIRYRFVGYGWRFSARYGTVHNVSGFDGLQLVLPDGRKLLIGTQRPELLREMLRLIHP